MENGTLNSVFSIASNSTAGSETQLTALMVLEYILFSIIFIVGVVGNILVCLVILKTPSMRSTRNYLIVNLAIADITVALVCIPFDVVIKVYGDTWVLGAVLCKIIWPSMTLVTTCSAATLAAISFDRYRAVVHPWKPRLTQRQTAIVIFATWLFSLLIVLPYVIVLKLDQQACDEFWHKDLYRQTYTAFLFIFAYSLPLVIIAFAYIRVALKLKAQAEKIALHKKASGVISMSKYNWANKNTTTTNSVAKEDISENVTSSPRPSRSKDCALLSEEFNSSYGNDKSTSTSPSVSANPQKEAKKLERNTRIVKMLVTVVLFYASCLLPNQLVWMWFEFGSGRTYSGLTTLLTFTNMLVYINSIVNPFLYAGMNEEFKKGFERLLCCHRRCRKAF